MPPLEMRTLVGPTDAAAFDNPGAGSVYPYVPHSAYESVFDFGCGCGRVARQLMLQHPRPSRYLGIDLHRGMIEWCRANLQAVDRRFEFKHHDVWNYHFNSAATATMLPFPTRETFTLVNAISVFTHLTETQAGHYLHEVCRILAPDGYIVTTWLLFDKAEFPFMHEVQNALYVSTEDPGAAALFDRSWLERRLCELGLAITEVTPPAIRGDSWWLTITRLRLGIEPKTIPQDEAPIGTRDLPRLPPNPEGVGLE